MRRHARLCVGSRLRWAHQGLPHLGRRPSHLRVDAALQLERGLTLHVGTTPSTENFARPTSQYTSRSVRDKDRFPSVADWERGRGDPVARTSSHPLLENTDDNCPTLAGSLPADAFGTVRLVLKERPASQPGGCGTCRCPLVLTCRCRLVRECPFRSLSRQGSRCRPIGRAMSA